MKITRKDIATSIAAGAIGFGAGAATDIVKDEPQFTPAIINHVEDRPEWMIERQKKLAAFAEARNKKKGSLK